jgi:uncharacterized protein YcfJ
MKIKFLVLLSILVVTSGYAAEYATVVSVKELNETRLVPSQECHTESVPVYGRDAARGGALGGVVDATFGSTGGLIGAIAGGYIGSKFGKGNGRRAATVAGAAIGAQLGDPGRYRDSQVIGYQDEYQCNEVMKAERFSLGYLVTYQYRGQEYEDVLSYKPSVGSKRAVTVSLR